MSRTGEAELPQDILLPIFRFEIVRSVTFTISTLIIFQIWYEMLNMILPKQDYEKTYNNYTLV